MFWGRHPTVMRPVSASSQPTNGPPGVLFALRRGDQRLAQLGEAAAFLRSDQHGVVNAFSVLRRHTRHGSRNQYSRHALGCGSQEGFANEYSVESLVQVSRQLEVNKQHINNIHPSMSANWRTSKCTRWASECVGMEA